MLAKKPPLAVTIKSACEQLSLSKSTIYRMIREDRLQALKAGRRTLVTMQSIDDFCAGR